MPNSQLHFGVFLNGKLEGAMQFGPSLDKRKIQGLVRETSWNGFLELNRMAFSERLPRNSESRALSIAFRLIRQHYPHIQWIISFADGTQSGDGTIYRAAGFALTGIRKNTTIWSNGSVKTTNITSGLQPNRLANVLNKPAPGRALAELTTFSRVSLTAQGRKGGEKEKVRARELCNRVTVTKGKAILNKIAMQSGGFPGKPSPETGSASMRPFIEAGFKPLPGFQLRYIYFLDPTARERLVPPILPFSKIDELGARMYLGQAREKQAMAEHPSDQRRGSTDPHAPKTQTPRPKGAALLGMSTFRELRRRYKRHP